MSPSFLPQTPLLSFTELLVSQSQTLPCLACVSPISLNLPFGTGVQNVNITSVIFICISLLILRTFLCTFSPHSNVFFCEKCLNLLSSFLFCSFSFVFVKSLGIFWIKLLSHLSMYSQSVVCLFVVLMLSFDDQKVYIFII